MQPIDYAHEWKVAKCIRRINPRTYLVEAADGSRLVRNRRFLAVKNPHCRPLEQVTTRNFDSPQALEIVDAHCDSTEPVRPLQLLGSSGQQNVPDPQADQEVETPAEQETMAESPTVISEEIRPADSTYTTRSGRGIKAPHKLNL